MLTLQPGGGAVARVALSADGGRVVAFRRGRWPIVWAEQPDWRWHVVPGADPWAPYRPGQHPCGESLALDPAGRFVAAAGPSRVLAAALDGGAQVELDPPAATAGWSAMGLRFARDGRELVCSTALELARYDAGDWRRAAAALPDHFAVEYQQVWPGAAGRLAARTRRPWEHPFPVRLHYLTSPDARPVETVPFRDHGGDAAFSPDGERFALGGERHTTLYVWDTATAATLVERLTDRGPRYAAPAFTPDGRTLLLGRGPAVVSLDAITGEDRWTLDWNAGRVLALAVSGDGLTAAAGTASGRVVLWDLDG